MCVTFSPVGEGQGEGPSYGYTPAGRLLTRTWARGIVTTYAYNNAGDLASVDYSDTTPDVTYTYDRRGRRLSASSAQSAVTYSYSDAGQLLAETHTAGPLAGITVTNSYDTLQRRSAVAVQSSSLIIHNSSFSYDSASRLAAVSAGNLSAAYAYVPNAPGLVSDITFRTAGAPMMTTTKTYDNLNRLTKIETTTGGRPVSSHTYQLNAANQRTKRTDADNSYWDYAYDSLGQVTNAVRRWSDNSLVAGQQYGYQFDDIGNRRQSAVGDQLSAYTANLLNQYTQRTVPGFIDILGSAATNATVTVNGTTANRQGEYFHSELALANTNAAAYSPVAITATMTSGTNNVAVTNTGTAFLPQTPEQFTHDQDGNLTQDGRWQYTWDGENRLIGMETDTNKVGAASVPRQKLIFQYDAQSRRISKTVSNWTGSSWVCTNDLRFVYDGWNLLAEVGTTGSVVRSYAWGLDLSGSQTGAGGIGGLLFIGNRSSAIGDYATAYDGNGNVSALLDMRTGQVAGEYEYSPFGETIRATGTLAKENPFRFSTKRTDDTTGLILYEYRILQTPTGRWLSRDPIDEQGGANIYAFVKNDPLTKQDKNGLITLDSEDLGEQVLSDTDFDSTYNCWYCPKRGGVTTASTRDGKRDIEVKGTVSSANSCGCTFEITKVYHRVKSYFPTTVSGNPGLREVHEAGHRVQFMIVAKRFTSILSERGTCTYRRENLLGWGWNQTQDTSSCTAKAAKLKTNLIARFAKYQNGAGAVQDNIAGDLTYTLAQTQNAIRLGIQAANSMTMKDWCCDDTVGLLW